MLLSISAYHHRKETDMVCEFCKKAEVIEGTLEGISFEPAPECKKRFATGVYGITATACPECGHLADIKLDAGSLRKIVQRDQ